MSEPHCYACKDCAARAERAEADCAALRRWMDRALNERLGVDTMRDGHALLAAPNPGAGWESPEVVAEVREILERGTRSYDGAVDHCPCGRVATMLAALAKLPKGGES